MPTAEECFRKDKIYLTLKYPYISTFLLSLRVQVTDRVNTAAVNDTTVFLNEEFYTSLPDRARIFVLAHETLHSAFRHTTQEKSFSVQHKEIFNIAADAVINEILAKDGFSVLRGSVMYQTIREQFGITDIPDNISAIELYNKIIERLKGNSQNSKNVNGNNPLGNDIDINSESSDNSDEKNQEDDNGKVLNKGNLEGLEPEELERRKEELMAEVEQSMKMAGSTSSELYRHLAHLLNPKIPWYKEVSSYIFSVLPSRRIISTWKRPNRKTSYYPGTKRLSMPSAYILLDVSSSISEEDINQFITEIFAMSKYIEEVTVISYNTEIVSIMTKKSQWIKPEVSGGTDPSESMIYVNEHIKRGDVVVHLTDGYWGFWKIKQSEAVKLSKKIQRKATKVIYVTVGITPEGFEGVFDKIYYIGR